MYVFGLALMENFESPYQIVKILDNQIKATRL